VIRCIADLIVEALYARRLRKMTDEQLQAEFGRIGIALRKHRNDMAKTLAAGELLSFVTREIDRRGL
jgi:hypothetical protein